jgi:hypothetical protein
LTFVCFPNAKESGKHNSAHPFGWDVQTMGEFFFRESAAIVRKDQLEELNPLHVPIAPVSLAWARSTKERTLTC